MERQVVIILPDIRSAQNVGSIFRSADGFGVSKIYLTGTTPVPVDKFGRANSRITKTSLGAEKILSWDYQKTAVSVISKLKKDGFKIVAIEQDKKSVSLEKIKGQKIALVFGNEVLGLPKSILNKCDQVAEIEMMGEKESFNVAVTCGIALYEVSKSKPAGARA